MWPPVVPIGGSMARNAALENMILNIFWLGGGIRKRGEVKISWVRGNDGGAWNARGRDWGDDQAAADCRRGGFGRSCGGVRVAAFFSLWMIRKGRGRRQLQNYPRFSRKLHTQWAGRRIIFCRLFRRSVLALP